MVQIVDAEVKFPAGKAFESRYGRMRQNVVFITESEEITKWFDEGDQRYVRLKRGDWVQLLKDGDKISIVEPEPEAEPQPERQPSLKAKKGTGKPVPPGGSSAASSKAKTPEWKRSLYEQMKTRADILTACHVEIHKRFIDERGKLIIAEETLQKYATTLFISLKDSIQ
jgi:hypothetical protein